MNPLFADRFHARRKPRKEICDGIAAGNCTAAGLAPENIAESDKHFRALPPKGASFRNSISHPL
jgi:hypothetical protein